MEIKRVNTIEESRICDSLLTKLIQDEAKYNKMINPNFVVNNYFENVDKENNCLLVAKNEIIVGYVFVKRIESEIDNQSIALIDGIYVEEEYRNQGIASKLIEKSLDWCKENFINIIKIKVMTQNEGAINLYQKFGFTELAKEMVNYLD